MSIKYVKEYPSDVYVQPDGWSTWDEKKQGWTGGVNILHNGMVITIPAKDTDKFIESFTKAATEAVKLAEKYNEAAVKMAANYS